MVHVVDPADVSADNGPVQRPELDSDLGGRIDPLKDLGAPRHESPADGTPANAPCQHLIEYIIGMDHVTPAEVKMISP